jgi:two-component system sensor histidine kinase UhpB
LRATLVAPHGAILARSAPLAASDPAPRWFYQILVHEPGIVRIGVPTSSGQSGVIMLETDSRNEIAEAWSDATLTFTILALFCGSSALLVYWIVGRALKPLNMLVQGFQRVGRGDYAPQAPAGGPTELAQLSSGFNQMVDRLGRMSQRKDQLEEQLVEAQEEERAEIARDLHDEIGPLLFAVSVDLAAFQEHEGLRSDPQLRTRLAATTEAIARMRQHVKAILGRLKPPTVADLGLRHSVERLIAFWSTRYPQVSFQVDIAEEDIGADVAVQLYRIIQESVNNALRHGRATLVGLKVLWESDSSLLLEVSDNGVGLQAGNLQGGFGLSGMRERVATLGGELAVAAGPDGCGVTVRARLPLVVDEFAAWRAQGGGLPV